MYLSKIHIKNFRGIKELLVEFDKKLNVIIGANGQLKTSLMDAIRLFYVWGEPNRDIEINKEDFHVEITQDADGTKTITQSTKIDINKLKHLPTTEDMFVDEYGAKGTASRDEFDAKSRAWYYAEVLKNARKSAGITQQQLADKIGKKREYVAMLEKGETDMQLSTFIMISEAVGLKFALTY